VTTDSLDYLSVDDLLEIAAGVIGEFAIRDPGLLASAAARPRTSAFGADAYPSFVGKAAALMHSIARNHALIDDNKRLAWAAARSFCLLNGHDLVFTVDDAEQLIQSVVRGELEAGEIERVLAAHLTSV
jgi:death-on-curing protein